MASLEEVLAARDARAARQRRFLAASGLPLLSLTLVSPGPVKDSPGRRRLMYLAECAFADAFHRAGWTVRMRARKDGITGPEALWAVEVDPDLLKRSAVALEDAHPWGRLLDADVVVAGPEHEPALLAREDLGLPPRPCLVCGASVRTCLALRSHAPGAAARAAASLLVGCVGEP